MKTKYTFNSQLQAGKAGEWVMRKYHQPFYAIQKTSLTTELNHGYDFLFTWRGSNRVWKVEIKTDFKTASTGNIVIETLSKDTPLIDGWAVTSKSDVIVYYLWDMWEVLYFWTSDIKRLLKPWRRRYGEQPLALNPGYTSAGILLPVQIARETAFQIRRGIDAHWMKANYKRWLKGDTNQ